MFKKFKTNISVNVPKSLDCHGNELEALKPVYGIGKHKYALKWVT